VAAPQYVPSTIAEQPRRGLDLPPPSRWLSDRPGDLGPAQPVGEQLGRPGPDQGYALRLARHFTDKLVVSPPERAEDTVAGCVAVATARSALFGRAPIVHDLDIAFRIWGFLGDAPDELVELRRPLFEGAVHGYSERRAIVDHVPEETLRLSHGQVASRFPADWRALLDLS
jgi:hypothetical protein